MNTKSKSLGYRIYLISVVAAFAVALLLRTLSLFLSLDKLGYFGDGVLPILTAIVQIAATVGVALYPFFMKKDTLASDAKLSPVSGITAILAAALLAASAVFAVIGATESKQPLLFVGAVLCLLCGIVYFVLRLKNQNGAWALMGFGIILAGVLLISLTYFDLYVPMNAPRKTSLHLALLAMMLYVLYEMRTALSRPMPRALAACSAACSVLTLSMAGANLIYAIANGDGALYVSGNLLALAIGLFAGVRMTDMARSASQVTESEDAAQ